MTWWKDEPVYEFIRSTLNIWMNSTEYLDNMNVWIECVKPNNHDVSLVRGSSVWKSNEWVILIEILNVQIFIFPLQFAFNKLMDVI